MTDLRFTFRLLAEDDFEMMHGWLNEPGVVRWPSDFAPERPGQERLLIGNPSLRKRMVDDETL